MVLEEKLKKLEEECKQKETERVNLELELTEVKESLKKALAGGITLGLAIEPRSGTSSPQVQSTRSRERGRACSPRLRLIPVPQRQLRQDTAHVPARNTFLGCVSRSRTLNFFFSVSLNFFSKVVETPSCFLPFGNI